MLAPAPVPRPAFAAFIEARKLKLREVGEALDCSGELVRLICLPFHDKRRRVPGAELMGRIVAWTGGQVVAGDFYPEHLNGRATAPQTQEAAR